MTSPYTNPDEYFILDDCMYHVSKILFLRLDGGTSGFGCWGEIELKEEDRCAIGDGSYRYDQEPSGSHIKHRVANEYNFKKLRKIMNNLGATL